MALKIFISHKMPTSSAAAKAVGGLIAEASGPLITVINAAQFRYGTDFRSKIREELETTDIFILFYTGEDADWSYCLWECGNFERLVSDKNNKSIIVMHDPKIDPPEVLKIYKSLPNTDEEILAFLQDLYVKQWKVFPDVSTETLKRNAKDIVSAFALEHVNFDVAPNFSIRVILSDENRQILHDNGITSDSYLSGGSLSWQRLFGKVTDTNGWSWAELTKDWHYRELYEYEFARMMVVALNERGPEGCLLRDEQKNLFYLNLRRFEKSVVDQYATFMFSAFKIENPIYAIKGSATSEEIISYNVLNVCWYTRRRLIDELYPKLLQILVNNDNQKDNCKLLQQVRNELNSITVQSTIRDLDNLMDSKKLFEIKRIVKDGRMWDNIKDYVRTEGAKNSPDLASVANIIYDLAKLNLEYYQETASKFAKSADALSLPERPDEYIKLGQEDGKRASNLAKGRA
jgi:hypothetical protein